MRPTVFVVDDDSALREGLAMSLGERGYQVQGFESAERFLAAYQPPNPGCLLLDVQMPQSSGLELQDVLNRRGIKIPIIFVTGHGDVPTAAQAMREGALDFLEKPYQLDVLVRRVEEAMTLDEKNRNADAVNQALMTRFERLSPREREVMAMICAGVANTSNREVAQHLGISPRTVETYRARLMEKMQARSLPDLVDMARVCGIHESPIAS